MHHKKSEKKSNEISLHDCFKQFTSPEMLTDPRVNDHNKIYSSQKLP